ncbi:MAG TPA: TMEM175 family protein [Xanthobacteraceae bacterium]|jgi:uncharacterized membrane protein|nr:TMEM175 family protein [Xanthobacteraceae bacterium]
MGPDRLTAFSDGVIAVIITIMVLEMKPPEGADLSALGKVLPTFLSYVLSFVYVAIYWNNHHHLLSVCKRVSGLVLWANTHLLFWLSLIPFTTAWLESNQFAPLPTALYGVSLLMPAIAYWLLERALLRAHGPDSRLAAALGSDIKAKISPLLYFIAVVLAFPIPLVSIGIYVAVALLWLIPDRRMERALALDRSSPSPEP